MTEKAKSELYRLLPQIGALLESERFPELQARFGRDLVAEGLRRELAGLREGVRVGSLEESSLAEAVAGLGGSVERRLR